MAAEHSPTPPPPGNTAAEFMAAASAEARPANEATAGTEPPAAGAPQEMQTSHADEDDEPQSTLTSKFTAAEWESLKEFRAMLPAIFADGHPDNPKAKDTAITFWGIHIDPHHPKDAQVNVVLMKFLRAKHLNVKEARGMLVSTLRWRESFGVDAAVKEEFPEDVFGRVGHIFGRDKEGRPVVYNIYGGNNVQAAFSDVPRFLRWRIALMEKSVATLDFTEVDEIVPIHDYAGVNLRHRDKNSKSASSEVTSIFHGHYPGLLHKKIYINVPTVVSWGFWAFKRMISAKTLAEMTVVGSGRRAIKKALLSIIDAKELPQRYGGDAEAF